MSLALGTLGLTAVVLSVFVYIQSGTPGLRAAGKDALNTLKGLAIRLPCALLAASFLVHFIPVDAVSSVLGRDTGTRGIAIAAAAGGFLPGGPMVTFPIAVVLQQSGAGLPQLVALISGWSIFALNRLLTYEAPIMGWRFAILRNLSCLLLPVLAGLGAEFVLVFIEAE